jgi:hypothetical protein
MRRRHANTSDAWRDGQMETKRYYRQKNHFKSSKKSRKNFFRKLILTFVYHLRPKKMINLIRLAKPICRIQIPGQLSLVSPLLSNSKPLLYRITIVQYPKENQNCPGYAPPGRSSARHLPARASQLKPRQPLDARMRLLAKSSRKCGR